MKRLFTLYIPGETRIAGLRILAQANVADSKTYTYYQIRYDCCDKLDTLSHRDIELRHKAGATKCARCARVHNGRMLNGVSPTTPYVKKDEVKFIIPPWPVPSRNESVRKWFPNQI